MTAKLTTTEFIRRAKLKHGNKYIYKESVYTGMSMHLKIGCKVHGIFSPIAGDHLSGSGCRKCADNQNSKNFTYTTEKFVQKATAVHGNRYDYSKSKYISCDTPVIITCRVHGDFLQKPIYHTNNSSGCSKCGGSRYSKASIRWIEAESKSRRLKGVLHAENGGEYQIPGTRLRVDGYHPRSKTIFEFYGDDIHGNPLVHSPRSKPHPFLHNCTARKLYTDTLNREKLLLKLGYKLITMWQSDFRKSSVESYRRKQLYACSKI